jgi:hypothetical protein
MFWRSWSVVNATGGGAPEELAELCPTTAAEQKLRSETAMDFKKKCTASSGNGILAAPQKAIYFGRSS